MLESAGLQRDTAAVRSLVCNPLFFPGAKLNIPSESCMLSAAPFCPCNCLLSAGVGSARLTSVPDSLCVNVGGKQSFSRMGWNGQWVE